MIRKRLKIRDLKSKIANEQRQGVALLVVLFVIMTITILSLGFLSRSDVELSCGKNMILRSQMDYLAESGLIHARGLILNPQDAGSEYWTGAAGQQLVAGSDDYYDVAIIRDDSELTDRCNYIIDCNSYRLKNGEKIGCSSIRAELRLDQCIAYWAGLSTAFSPLTTVNGDVYCAGDLSNNGVINGDVFAGGNITGTNITGHKNGSAAQPPVAWPALEVSDFSSTYYIGTASYSVDLIGFSVHPSGSFNPSASNPAGIRYINGDLELPGNVDIEGMLVVNGTLRISGANNVIRAAKNFPAVLIGGDVIIEGGANLDINGLAVIKGQMQVSADNANVNILGGLFIEDGIVETTADSSGNGNTGALGNNPVWRPSGGKTNGALEFDGIDDYVAITHSPSLDVDNITVCAWVNHWDTGDDRVVCKSTGTAVADHIFSLGVSGTTVRARVDNSSSNYDATTACPKDTWTHLAFTYDGSNVCIYVDGQPAGVYPYSGGPITKLDWPVTIGNVNLTDNRYFNGMIDDVRIYNRALDANDIYPPKDGLSGLVGHWKLDESGSNISITAAPSIAAIEVWPQAGVAQRWEQADNAFFKSIERK